MSIAALCVPSMGENQKGFKSLVYRMKTKKGLSEANCVSGDRAWEGRLGDCQARSAYQSEAMMQSPKG